MATFNKVDLQFILAQILAAEAGQPPVNPHLPFGLREVSGSDNNAVPGQETFGSADQLFPRVGDTIFSTGTFNIDGTIFDPHPGVAGDTYTARPDYSSTLASSFVIDSAPRTISNLISDQSIANAAALDAAQIFAAQLGAGYTVLPANPTLGPDGTYYGTSQNLFIGNITPDAGLSAPFNTWMTLFGQFFDHGLDLVNKGGNGVVFIPLQPDDPLIAGKDGQLGTKDDLPPEQRFMMLTRATDLRGPDGIQGTADDIHENINSTTPFVDQNQTYTSHPAHQAFLREYVFAADGKLHSTGRLLTGRNAGTDGQYFTGDDVVDKGMPTWGYVKAASRQFLGIILDDRDVGDVPLLVTDDYGNLKLDAQGRVQLVVDVTETIGGVSTTTQRVVAASGASPVDIHNLTIAQVAGFTPAQGATYTVKVVHTGHAFLNDIAHNAAPVLDASGNLLPDADLVAGNVIIPNAQGQNPVYDNELLNAHYIAGDGRANENFGLTAVHEVFHSEHNRLVEQVKQLVRNELAKGDTAFASDWVLPGANLADGIQDIEWNGERLFQAAKFGTETQYQHLVFEEFARKISPTIHLFGNVDIALNPAITAEFAHAVYRFGHSMLDESLPRYLVQPATLPDGSPNPLAGTPVLDANGQPVLSDSGLIQAFLNPLAYASQGANAAGEVALATTHQIGNEIDEFVTGALRDNLLGLPLDLAALNIARGRETGVPPLNLLRNELFSQTQDTTLRPYASWDDLGQFLKHPLSLVNFVAAYGTHASILAATTLADKRAAAVDLVTIGENALNKTAPEGSAERDAYDFMHSLGVYKNETPGAGADGVLHTADDVFASPVSVHAAWSTGSVTGVDNVDLWIGGLAEKQSLFGGLLGSTFDFIFRTQLESLQDGDRLYYLPRIEGLHWGSEIEANSFADLIMRNTGLKHLPAAIFMTPEYTVEAATVGTDPSTWLKNPVAGNILVERLSDEQVHALVDGLPSLKFNDGVHNGFDTQVRFIGDDNFLGNTMVLGGTDGRDVLIAGHADDDTVWGDGGDDYIDGGNGNDQLFGGKGNDTIVDSGGNDIIHGEEGNDTVFAGIGDDTVFGGDGNDFLDGGRGIDVMSGGLGNDIILGGEGDDELVGNEGDDWIEGGGGGDLIVGDQGAPTGQMPLVTGNDVLDGGATGDRMLGFNGDDIMLGQGGFDKFDGGNGYDWASFEKEIAGVSVDMRVRELIPNPAAPAGGAVRDVFADTEAVSGTGYDDVLIGTDFPNINPLNQPINVALVGAFNQLDNVNLINGLASYFPASFPLDGPPKAVAYNDGNIMLGGDGNDRIQGGGGNDIIDGDAWLHVGLSERAAGGQIIREILYDTTPGDIDTAVFTDVSTNYDIGFARDPNDPTGGTLLFEADGVTPVLVVSHRPTTVVNGNPVNVVSDGTDILHNIERLEFADITMDNQALLILGLLSNFAPTGTVVIQGDTNAANAGVDPVVGSVLSADVLTGGLFDANGIVGALRYQWQYQEPTKARWVDIAGATSVNFTPTDFVNTLPLRVQVSFTDGLGFNESVHSVATNPVTLPAGVNTAPFVVQQQGVIGFLDTTAQQGGRVSLFLDVTTAFRDQQTPVGQLVYKAELVLPNGTAQPLDGTGAADNLTFAVQRDATGAVIGASITGTLPPDVTGPLQIRVTATDRGPGDPLSVTTPFTINVQPVNHAPVAQADSYSVGEDGVLVVSAQAGVLANDTDPDHNALTALLQPAVNATTGIVNGPSNGTVVLAADGSFRYTPNANFAGTDTFVYRASDGRLSSADTTVTVAVAAANDGAAPVTLAGQATFSAVAAQNNTLTAVLGADPDGAPPASGAGAPQYQWLRNNAPISTATNSTYTLTSQDVGQSISVRVSYTDGQGFLEQVTSTAAIVGNAINGTTGNDTISPTATNVALRSTAGADVINGQAGNDTINAGAGNDLIVFTFGQGRDAINGGDGTDTLNITTSTSGSSSSTLTVSLNASGQVTSFADTQGTSTVSNVESINVDLGTGTDTLVFSTPTTTPAKITVNMITGQATGLASMAGVENITGGDGADTFIAAVDDIANRFNGGAGADTVDYSAFTAGLTVTLNTGTLVTVTGSGGSADQIQNIESFIGGSGNDTITGDGNANALSGGAGDDILSGAGGADTLSGGDGNDTLNGGAGNDSLIGGAGNDNLTGGTGDDVIDGGANNDTINYVLGDGADRIDGGADTDTLAISAGAAVNSLLVSLNAAGGVVTGFNDGASPVTVANVEAITVNLGGGVDSLSYNGTGTAVVVDLVRGFATGLSAIANIENFTGGSGDDLFVAAVDNVRNDFGGGAGADTIDYSAYTTALNVTLNGSNQVVVGGSGTSNGTSDRIVSIQSFTGGSGNDTIRGDTLDNTLSGGAGADTLSGRGGADTFVFKSGYGRDIITDFSALVGTDHDVIQLSMGAGFSTYDQVMKAAVQTGSSVTITFDDTTTLTLQNTLRENLTQDDFRFA